MFRTSLEDAERQGLRYGSPFKPFLFFFLPSPHALPHSMETPPTYLASEWNRFDCNLELVFRQT